MMKIYSFALLSWASCVMSTPFFDQSSLSFGWSGFEREEMQLSKGTLFETLRKDSRFSKLVQVLEENRGLKDDLDSKDTKMTIFAPTNEAFERLEERMRQESDEDAVHSMDQLIRYHMTREKLNMEDIYDGMTIKTELKLRELDNERQRIRVFKCSKGQIALNMYARVHVDELKAENGNIMAIDQVLVPPKKLLDTLSMFPTKFSTFVTAVSRVGMQKQLENRAITAFVAPNAAWETLGFHQLMWLFSESGKEQLKKIVEYHISPRLVYADKIISKEKFELESGFRGEKLLFTITPRHQSKYEWSQLSEKQCPSDFIISINHGEARLVFTDALVANGDMHLINSVLVPPQVKLPADYEF